MKNLTCLLVAFCVLGCNASNTLYFKRNQNHRNDQQPYKKRQNGMASPPRGWYAGERYDCNIDCDNYPDDCISEKLVKRTADAMVDKGLVEAGFTFLSLGDCWSNKTRSFDGQLIPDPKRFPSGMKQLVDYVHDKGLMFGLYLDIGNATSHGYPGSEGHKTDDARRLSSWGVDFVRLDYFYSTDSNIIDKAFTDMAQQIKNTGRDIMLSCAWPVYEVKRGVQPNYDLISQTCDTFMTYPEIGNDWVDLLALVKHFADYAKPLVNYTGPNKAWNEVCQTMVGDFGLSGDQVQMQLGLLAILAAPFMLSTDVSSLSDHSLHMLLNSDLLSISQTQEPMGFQKEFDGQVRFWIRSLHEPSGSFAMALTYENISGGPVKVSKKIQDLGFTTAAAYNFTDVFSGEFLGTYKPWHTLDCEVNPTGIRLIKAVALA